MCRTGKIISLISSEISDFDSEDKQFEASRNNVIINILAVLYQLKLRKTNELINKLRRNLLHSLIDRRNLAYSIRY